MEITSRKNQILNAGQSEVEIVESPSYLGANFAQVGEGSVDLKKRIAQASVTANKPPNVMNAGKSTEDQDY